MRFKLQVAAQHQSHGPASWATMFLPPNVQSACRALNLDGYRHADRKSNALWHTCFFDTPPPALLLSRRGVSNAGDVCQSHASTQLHDSACSGPLCRDKAQRYGTIQDLPRTVMAALNALNMTLLSRLDAGVL